MKKLLTTSAIILALTAGVAQAREGGFRHGGIHRHMEETLAKLPEDKANLFRDSMKQVREQNQSKREQLRSIGKEIEAILTAPEFDKSAYLAKTQEAQGIFSEMHSARSTAFADVVAQLTQEERKIIAEALPHKHKGKYFGKEKPEVE